MTTEAEAARALRRIRLVHTAAWAAFAGAILAIPPVTLAGELRAACWLSALVWVEVAILAGNRMRCPLTRIAARYTDDRRDNFDIYLPLWLARRNKLIFGALFAAGQLMLLSAWLRGA
ncbi:MAG: hypothetical protein AB7O49_03020 [Sphingomonadales bacterium]